MPRHCSVFCCRSNKSEPENCSTFSLPKDENLKKLWLRKIPTDLTKLKNPVICVKHFPDEAVIREEQFIVDGALKTFQRTYPKLKPDAVPTIFPKLPGYLSKAGPSCKRLCDVEKERLDTVIAQSLIELKNYNDNNVINCLSNLYTFFSSNEHKFEKGWVCIKDTEKLVFCFVDVCSDKPKILCSVCVCAKLTVNMVVNGNELPEKKVLKKFLTIKTKNDFEELLSYVKSLVNDEVSNNMLLIKDITKQLKENFGSESLQVQFLIEQLSMINVTENNRRYSAHTLLFSALLFMYSPTGYSSIYKSSYLFLPHPSNVRKLMDHFKLNNLNIDGSIDYLKLKKNFLKEHELCVNIILDEIYIESQLCFKGDTIYGSCNTAEMAKTVQVFMISSIFSNYRDVVSLIPVQNLTAVQLKDMILNVISEVEKLGFVTFSLISDNNAVNRKALELLTPNGLLQPSIPHPTDSSRQLFFIFDSVHLMKCIRNNWINKKMKTLKYPSFNNLEIMACADFKYLELLYNTEKDSLVKMGHLLSSKVLYPTNIQRQNVTLALRVFGERTIAALKCMAQKDVKFTESLETASFMKIICVWWQIVNVKGAFEGKRFNNIYREPIKKDDFVQLDFLRKMSHWLKIWRQSVEVGASLSGQTFQAMINTIDAFLLIIPYIFQNFRADYILLGKFQSDNLEGRFGHYRQLCGANYYLSYVQVLESERKLRFRDCILLSFKNGNIPLKSLLPCSDNVNDCVNIDRYLDILLYDFDLQSVSEDVLPILLYISGFGVKKRVVLKKMYFV